MGARRKKGTMNRAPTKAKKQIPRYARNNKFRRFGTTRLGRGDRGRRKGLEGFGEEGLGVEVLLFEVGVEEHGGIADKDAA
jgi:hypothetical protein